MSDYANIDALRMRTRDMDYLYLERAEGDALLDELAMRRQQVLDLGEDLNGVELRAETAEAECKKLREALADAVSSVGEAHRGYCGDHHVYSPQISESTLERWRAALAAQERATTQPTRCTSRREQP